MRAAPRCLSEIQGIPTEIEDGIYRRDDGKNQTG
jgi:hypothetical protein